MADAFQQSGADGPVFGWTPADGLSSFLRIVGPQTLTGIPANNGSPAPYPSFQSYLNGPVAAGTACTVSGSAGVGAPAPQPNNVDYVYSGTFASDDSGGYTLTLTGTMTERGVTPAEPYGLYADSSGNTTAQQLPPNLPVTLVLSAGAYDNNTYSADASAFTVGQSSDPKGPNYLAPDLVPYTKNSPYANIAGDLPETPPYQSSAGSQLVVGTPFAPNADKAASPVVFPS